VWLAVVLLGGCASTVDTGSTDPGMVISGRVLLAPFENATDDENAGKILADLAATELMARGLRVSQMAPKGDGPLGEVQKFSDNDLAVAAKEKGARFIITGAALEYRYKTDLDGDPAVGIRVSVVEASSGKVAWQGSGSNVGVGFSSLTSAAQQVVKDVVSRMPIGMPTPPSQR
jgi:hypothetical protein